MKRAILISACFAAAAAAMLFGSRRAVAQEFSVGAYGRVQYDAVHTTFKDGSTPTNENSFSIPTLDIFLRGSLGNWSFLSEVLFDIDEGNTIGVDLDRFQVGYDIADWLKITAGRFHTSLGYYNTAYPQGGAVYLLPTDRPEVVDQHDNASIIPTSTVGINLRGRLPFAQQRFTYDIDISNGRGLTSDDLANGVDANNSKMLNLRLRYEINGLILGGNAMVDWIPPRGDIAAPLPTDHMDTIREQIFGAHLAYVEFPWHLIAEGYHISHIGANQTQRTIAGLAEIGYTVGTVTPYARYEMARFPSDIDVFWAPTHQQERGNYDAVSAGIKIMPNENFAVKFELEYNRGQTDTEYRAGTQVAFGF
jgi:opacity protein-like surface antigen